MPDDKSGHGKGDAQVSGDAVAKPKTDEAQGEPKPKADDDLTGLKSALERLKAERVSLKGELDKVHKDEADREAAALAAEEKRLKESGEFKTLSEKQSGELTKLQGEIDELRPLKAKLKAAEEALTAHLDARKKELALDAPTLTLLEKLGSVEQLGWISANAEALVKRGGGSTFTDGRGGARGEKKKLTIEEQAAQTKYRPRV